MFKYPDDDDNLMGTEDEYYNIGEEQALKEADKTGNKMILLEPRAYSESQQIADHLKNRNSVVVNLKRVTSDQAKRIGQGIQRRVFGFVLQHGRQNKVRLPPERVRQ